MTTTTRERVAKELRSMQPALIPVIEPTVYGVRRTICVCMHDTLSTCRECGGPACGDCLDTTAHALRFHKTAA